MFCLQNAIGHSLNCYQKGRCSDFYNFSILQCCIACLCLEVSIMQLVLVCYPYVVYFFVLFIECVNYKIK